MFDIGATELLVIAIVAILVIGKKDLPLAMRTAGRWIGKFRRTTAHFRTGIDAMVREAEMEDLDKKWREQNAKIMAQYPDDQYPDDQHSEDQHADREMVPLNEQPGAMSAAEAREAQVKPKEEPATDGAKTPEAPDAPSAAKQS